jgi:hypothetical protein
MYVDGERWGGDGVCEKYNGLNVVRNP